DLARPLAGAGAADRGAAFVGHGAWAARALPADAAAPGRVPPPGPRPTRGGLPARREGGTGPRPETLPGGSAEAAGRDTTAGAAAGPRRPGGVDPQLSPPEPVAPRPEGGKHPGDRGLEFLVHRPGRRPPSSASEPDTQDAEPDATARQLPPRPGDQPHG